MEKGTMGKIHRGMCHGRSGTGANLLWDVLWTNWHWDKFIVGYVMDEVAQEQIHLRNL
jgi:hypothetical protein